MVLSHFRKAKLFEERSTILQNPCQMSFLSLFCLLWHDLDEVKMELLRFRRNGTWSSTHQMLRQSCQAIEEAREVGLWLNVPCRKRQNESETIALDSGY